MEWAEIKTMKEGKILHDEFRDGMRFIIMKGPASLCAYIGLPIQHPLSGYDYDIIPLDCHGGLTYSGKGDGYRPEGFWWYGWDYAHSGDRCFYDDKYGDKLKEDKKWTVEKVIDDAWASIYTMKHLMELAEKIKAKG